MRSAVVAFIAMLASAPAGSAGTSDEYDCVTEPSRKVEVRAAVEGLITAIHADRGDRVRRGQVLVELDSGRERSSAELARFRATMRGTIRSAESRFEYAKLKAERNRQLHEEHFVSTEEHDEAATGQRLAEAELLETRDNRRVAELEYQRAVEELRLRTVLSPIDGVVVRRNLDPGELADNRDMEHPILELANVDVLHVEALLPLETYRRVRVGQEATVVPEEPVGGSYAARVSVVDALVDAASGTFGVRLTLPNPRGSIPAGIKCRVVFVDDGDARVPGGRMEVRVTPDESR